MCSASRQWPNQWPTSASKWGLERRGGISRSYMAPADSVRLAYEARANLRSRMCRPQNKLSRAKAGRKRRIFLQPNKYQKQLSTDSTLPISLYQVTQLRTLFGSNLIRAIKQQFGLKSHKSATETPRGWMTRPRFTNCGEFGRRYSVCATIAAI